MRPLHLLSIILITAFVLTACNTSSAPLPTPTAPPEPTAVTAKPLRVAVLMPSAANDLAFSQSMYDALVRIQSEMGGPEKMEFVYSQGMYIIDDAAAAIRTYASRDYDLVIAHGTQYGDILKEIAPEFPETSFAWGNSTSTWDLPNVFAYEAAAQEGGYVNGVLTATLTDSKVIGVIGPIETGDAKLYVDGFRAGVAATDPGIQVKVTYIGSFSDVVLASEAATTFISEGADIMTGTAQMVVGATGIAQENDVLWFGTQSNQSILGPEIVVASQVYHWEVVLKEIIAKIESGTLGGESFTINLANGGEVMEYNPAFALSTKARAVGDATVKGIVEGTITVPVP
ncbi:MAG TPA: BMP family protein [Anaerolineales bacterium]|nr:BMP family protein [Anaerolineales bacterium]